MQRLAKERLPENFKKADVAVRGVAEELRNVAPRYVESDEMLMAQFRQGESFGAPKVIKSDKDRAVGTAEKNAMDGGQSGELKVNSGGAKPEHIKGKLDEWIYGRSRPRFPAKTKNDVNLAAAQRADGKLICSTTGQPLEVQRKANGEPQFFKYNDKGRATKTEPPEWYHEWNEKKDPNPPIIQNNVEFTKPAPNVADMGHVDGAEYWRFQQFALYHKIDETGFREVYADADHYRLEERSANRGHGSESTEPGYGHYSELAAKYPPLPGAPDAETIIRGLKKPGSGG